MRVLLDENLPRRLKQHLPQSVHAQTVADCGWSAKKNGELLRLAVKEFDIFLTMDSGIEFQQNLDGFDIAIILLQAPSNRLADLLPLMPNLEDTIQSAAPGSLKRVATA